jgi:hypothetical protein
MTVGYDNFSLSLMMAPKKEKTITSNRTINGDSVMSISQQQAVGQITVSKSWVASSQSVIFDADDLILTL